MTPDLKTVVTENGKNTAKTEQEVKATLPVQPDALVTAVQGPLEKFMEAARVEAVVGAPIKHGDNLVIPTAEVFNAMGFGMGAGQVKDEDDDDNGRGAGGRGGGGGGQALARPVAVIVMSPAGVRVEPVVDVTKIALAAFTAAGFIGAMLWRMSRSGRVH